MNADPQPPGERNRSVVFFVVCLSSRSFLSLHSKSLKAAEICPFTIGPVYLRPRLCILAAVGRKPGASPCMYIVPYWRYKLCVVSRELKVTSENALPGL
jgi:hypothetical protein